MQCFRRVFASQTGNTSLLFAFAIVPLLAAVGSAVDYGTAIVAKNKITAATDASTLASLQSAVT